MCGPNAAAAATATTPTALRRGDAGLGYAADYDCARSKEEEEAVNGERRRRFSLRANPRGKRRGRSKDRVLKKEKRDRVSEFSSVREFEDDDGQQPRTT